MPSGKSISYRGYENVAIKKLLEAYDEQDIKTVGIPIISYEKENKKKRYFPDIWIPKENLIIEVKSTWAYSSRYEDNMLKKEACLRDGFNFQIWLCSGKEVLEII